MKQSFTKQGFTLIEAVLYVALSGMLATALFSSFNQTNRAVAQANAIIDLDIRSMIALNQLENDISGVFMPSYAKATAGKPPAGKPARPGQPPTQPKPKKQKIIKDLFLAKVEDGKLAELTFITNNPMQVYGKTIPRIARVAYKIKSDPDNKGAFRLIRQESAELDYEKWQDNPPREYPILDNIKNIKMSFKFQKTPLRQAQGERGGGIPGQPSQKQAEPTKIEYETKDDWESPVELDPKKPEKIIPQYVSITLELLDAQKRKVKFELLIRIWAYEATHRPPKEKKKPKPKRPPFKKGFPGKKPGSKGGVESQMIMPSGRLQIGKAVEGPFKDKPHMNKLFQQFYGAKKGKK